MNICVLIRSTTFHNKSGGLETQNKTLCEGLAKKGHKVIVVSTSSNISTLSHLQGVINVIKENGVEYHFINASSGIYSRQWWQESVIKFRELDGKYKFDVVISQSSAGKKVLSIAGNVKKIVINHGTALGELKTRFASLKSPRNAVRFILKDIPMVIEGYWDDYQTFRKADKIVCVSGLLADNLSREYPFVKGKVVVIENGVDLKRFETGVSKPASRGFCLLYVGRIVEEKGIGGLLKALSIVRDEIKDISLYIVGGGKDLDKFKDMTKRLKITDVVNYVGEVGNTEVVKYYKSSDVFVYPSLRQEGFPMVIAESMASGLPIIASRIGGIPNAIEDKKTGVLIEPGDIKNLVGAILLYYKNASLRETISQNAKRKAFEHYSQEAMVRSYLKAFENTP